MKHYRKCPACGAIHYLNPGVGMTERQRECLLFIEDYLDEFGLPPSYQEIGEALFGKVHSKSSVYRLVHALRERRYIEIIPDRARTMRVIRSLRAEIADREVTA